MSRSPLEETRQGGGDYVRGFEHLFRLLRRGASWSGGERGHGFLNTGGGRFAEISAVAGLDPEDDARGVALVDWDHDGDQDLWISNRNAPRVRFLRNDQQSGNHHLAVRLRGRTCNRDAIGARLVLSLGDGRRLVRSVRAGDGYLSQSSKWVHFGLGSTDGIDRLDVAWPDGRVERFEGLEADGRYLVTQGGAAEVISPRRQMPDLTPGPAQPRRSTEAARVVVAGRPLLPEVRYETQDGSLRSIDGARDRPLLVNLWASWCRPCLHEIDEWWRHADALEAAGLDVLLLNVDALDEGTPIAGSRAANASVEPPGGFEAARATRNLLDTLDVVHRGLLDRELPLPLPSSFLIGADGRLTVIYRGRVSAGQLVEDVRLTRADAGERREAASPFAGRWTLQPERRMYRSLAMNLAAAGRTDQALRYLNRLLGQARETFGGDEDSRRAQEAAVQMTRGQILQGDGRKAEAVVAFREAVRLAPGDRETRVRLAYLLLARYELEEAAEHFRRALEVHADDPELLTDLATLEHRQGDEGAAVAHWEAALALRPDSHRVANNLAWVHATSQDARIRAPGRAVELALRACRATESGLPAYLDTLAAAYAAAGRFEDAVAVAEQTIELAQSHDDSETVARMQERLEQYRNGRAIEAAGAKPSPGNKP